MLPMVQSDGQIVNSADRLHGKDCDVYPPPHVCSFLSLLSSIAEIHAQSGPPPSPPSLFSSQLGSQFLVNHIFLSVYLEYWWNRWGETKPTAGRVKQVKRFRDNNTSSSCGVTALKASLKLGLVLQQLFFFFIMDLSVNFSFTSLIDCLQNVRNVM